MQDSNDILRPRRPADFDAMYEATPPWDVGRPQTCFAELAACGVLQGRILDVGCGTGEHALMAAAAGLEAYGLDVSAAAIAMAREKARVRDLNVNFIAGSALDLPQLKVKFDTVLDSGLFHIFENDDRERFVDNLRSAVPPGGRYFMLCFSDEQPGDWGPRRVSKQEIYSSFSSGWEVESIVPARMALSVDSVGAFAWRAAIIRV